MNELRLAYLLHKYDTTHPRFDSEYPTFSYFNLSSCYTDLAYICTRTARSFAHSTLTACKFIAILLHVTSRDVLVLHDLIFAA